MARILHVTDTHLVVPPALVCGRLDTAACLEACVASIAAALPKIAPVDAILITGDLTDDGAPQSYRLLRETLAPLRLPLFAIPGNHDLREPMRAAFADAGLFPTQGRLNFVRDICGTGGDLRIVGIDTLVEGSGGGVVDAATLDFLDEALATTRPVLLAMHHPPFTSGIVFMDSIGLAGVEGLRDRLERAACQVRILCGHLHVAATGSLGRVPAIVGPSPCSAFDVDFRPDAPVGFFTGGGGFMVHDWSDGFRSLLVPPAIGAGPFPFRD